MDPILPVSNAIEQLFKFKPVKIKTISDLLTGDLKYSRETIRVKSGVLDEFIDIQSRNIEIDACVRNKTKAFDSIVNDCKKIPDKLEEEVDKKYDRLLIKEQSVGGDGEDETIDDMLKRIVNENKRYNKLLHAIDADTKKNMITVYQFDDLADRPGKLNEIGAMVVASSLVIQEKKKVVAQLRRSDVIVEEGEEEKIERKRLDNEEQERIIAQLQPRIDYMLGLLTNFDDSQSEIDDAMKIMLPTLK